MKYSSKYHIDKEIDIIMNKLYTIKRSFQVYKELKSEKNVKIICNQFPYLFSLILDSLKYRIFIELSKLVNDNYSDSISIIDLYKNYLENKNVFKVKKYYYVYEYSTKKRIRRYFEYRNIDIAMEHLNSDLINNNKIIKYLHKKRNKSLAHNNKKFSFDSKNKYISEKITYKEFENFINLLIKDVNEISYYILGRTYAFPFFELEEIDFLHTILKKDEQ